MQPGHILDIHCVRLSNAALLCEKYAKLYFDAKHLEKELNKGVGESFFQKKVPFLANIERCPKFLAYALPTNTSCLKNPMSFC